MRNSVFRHSATATCALQLLAHLCLCGQCCCWRGSSACLLHSMLVCAAPDRLPQVHHQQQASITSFTATMWSATTVTAAADSWCSWRQG